VIMRKTRQRRLIKVNILENVCGPSGPIQALCNVAEEFMKTRQTRGRSFSTYGTSGVSTFCWLLVVERWLKNVMISENVTARM
jgi:hypothetical protein